MKENKSDALFEDKLTEKQRKAIKISSGVLGRFVKFDEFEKVFETKYPMAP